MEKGLVGRSSQPSARAGGLRDLSGHPEGHVRPAERRRPPPATSFLVRGGVEHQASALEPSHVDRPYIYSPCRLDLRFIIGTIIMHTVHRGVFCFSPGLAAVQSGGPGQLSSVWYQGRRYQSLGGRTARGGLWFISISDPGAKVAPRAARGLVIVTVTHTKTTCNTMRQRFRQLRFLSQVDDLDNDGQGR